MPKAARRRSSPEAGTARAEPYPTIRPGDKPASKALAKLNDEVADELEKPKKTRAKSKTATEKAPKKTAAKAVEKRSGSFLDIVLDGELTDSVPMHDTCSEVRRKINLLLGKDIAKPENGVPGEFKKDGAPKPFTKALFCKTIGCSTRQLDTFMKAKMLMGGAESEVYPGAYKFFEKKRIFEGKKKTAGRLKVEANRPNGLPFRDPNKMRIWCGPGEHPSQFLDEYGQ